MTMIHTRRRFLTLSLAGAAGLVRAPPSLAAEGALETTTVRIAKGPAICPAPLNASEELLRAEGFTDIRYVEVPQAAGFVPAIAPGAPVVVLAGVHGGCYELFAQQNIRHIGELKGKQVAADNPTLFNVIAAQVGLDP